MTDKEREALEKEKRLAEEALVIAALVAIRKKYVEILKVIMADLSGMYMKLEKAGNLTYADAKRFRDLERFQRRVMVQGNVLGKNNKAIMEKLITDSYDLSYSYMSFAIQKETDLLLKNATPHLPEILDKVVKNPVYGLRLTAAQERDRALIVKGINEAVADGLKAGGTYGEIAKEIQKKFDSSYKRATLIAHTETHRVREQASHESAMNAYEQGIIMKKTWRNMGDERVRPGLRSSGARANHKTLEGQTKQADEDFITWPGRKGPCPGSIEGLGNSSDNIRCRCYASYRVDRLEAKAPKEAAENTEKDFKTWKKKQNG